MKTTIALLLGLLLVGGQAALSQSVIHPWHVIDNGGGTSAAGGMRAQTSIGQPAIAKMTAPGVNLESGYIPGLHYFSGSILATDVSVERGWNMVSVPFVVNDYRKISLYPAGTTNAIAYQGSYVVRDTLKNGVGYWIRFSGGGTQHFTGTSVVRETVTVNARWNMIGCLSYPLLSTDIHPLDSTTFTSSFWGYTSGSGYYVEDTLKPGRSYWVKVRYPGRILLQSGSVAVQTPISLAKRKQAQKHIDELGSQPEVNSLTFTDGAGKVRILFFVAGSTTIDMNKWEMPPSLEGLIDIRFATNRMLEAADVYQKKDVNVQVSSADYPLTISWNVKEHSMGTRLVIGGKDIVMTANGETHISNPTAQIKLSFAPSSGKELPKEYALLQNFPNPFNPTTTIRYDLPQQSRVRIVIYDALGREVTTIADEIQEAGFQLREWNSTNKNGKSIASGMYFYRIEATSLAGPPKSFTDVKKMLMIK